jgi:steroid 5-alpha reductase family enzyme
MTVPWHLVGLAFAVCLVVAAPGFRRVYYFVSLCYAGAIAALSVVFWLVFYATVSGWVQLQLVLLLAYGIRLGLFLAIRERNPAYAAELALAERRTAELKLWHKIAIWLGVSLLFTLLFLPALLTLSLQADGVWPVSTPLGVMIMVAGLAVESIADWQKYQYKAANPSHYCDVGLYRSVRCPNYFGEMLFWFGVWFAGLSAYHTVGAFVLAILGLLYIEILMTAAAAGLERKQDERYGDRADYQDYVRRVPILFPVVALYTLRKLRIPFR